MYRKPSKNAAFLHIQGRREKTMIAAGISKPARSLPIIHTSCVQIPNIVLDSNTGNSAVLIMVYYTLRCVLLCYVYKYERGASLWKDICVREGAEVGRKLILYGWKRCFFLYCEAFQLG